MSCRMFVLSLMLLSVPDPAFPQSPGEIVRKYESQARAEQKGFAGFSADRGRQLYFRKESSPRGDIGCFSCHSPDPKGYGRTRANKPIEPMASGVNPKRFTDFSHVEKWFSRNCDDVLKRPCSAQEKGDFVTFMLSIK